MMWPLSDLFANQSGWIGIFVRKWFIAMQIHFLYNTHLREFQQFLLLRQTNISNGAPWTSGFYTWTVMPFFAAAVVCSLSQGFWNISSWNIPCPTTAATGTSNQWQVRFTTGCREVLKLLCKFDVFACGKQKQYHWKSKSLACFYLFWIRKHQLATVPLELAVWCPFVVAFYLVFPNFKRKWSRIYYVYIYICVCIFVYLFSLYIFI